MFIDFLTSGDAESGTMANERMERMVQCFISLLLLMFCFCFGCKTPAGVVDESQGLAGCEDCIQRVSRVQRAGFAEISEGSGKSPSENEGKSKNTEGGDEEGDEQQTNEVEEVIDLDHPEDNYHEVYAEKGADILEYEGVLRWHAVEYQEAITRGIREPTFRNREVSAAHCHFSAAPNKDTPVFAMLVRHSSNRGDTFYLGREGMAISKVNTAALARGKRGQVQLVKSTMYCVYREDQNEVGALIFQFHDSVHESGDAQFALVRVEASSERQATARTMMVQEVQRDTRVVPASDVQVRVYEYVAAQSRVIGVFSTLLEALAEGEKVIPRGRFRLRVENTYPYMKWQSYLGVEDAEFCPSGVECRD